MFNGGTTNTNSAGKRKMNETDAEQTANQFNLFNLNGAGPSQFAPPSHVQQIHNTAGPTVKPFSFMSLLTADDDDMEDEYGPYGEANPLATEIRSQSQQVNHMISAHTDILKQALDRMLERQQKSIHRAAEASATKKLQQKEAELRMKAAHINELEASAKHYKRESDRLYAKTNYLEKKMMSLKSRLEKAISERRYGDAAREGIGSTPEDSDKAVVGPVRMDCQVCDRQLATVLMWPCRHVCVCKKCDVVTKSCPVCHWAKVTSFEVFLSIKKD
ncbi:hypothetical protein CASFOL_034217 [Castilleja foliolosa]|uniref:RING-type domain-containing protein n=1 Tax=Castilleja foliolosa TaxID=1961234 RepID=A0ABD3BY36_9LAMI